MMTKPQQEFVPLCRERSFTYDLRKEQQRIAHLGTVFNNPNKFHVQPDEWPHLVGRLATQTFDPELKQRAAAYYRRRWMQPRCSLGKKLSEVSIECLVVLTGLFCDEE